MAKVSVNDWDKIIELKNVCKSFDGKAVVKNLSLAIKRGSFVTLLGPSGCGKTTTLRMIAGFEEADSGEIYLEKQDVTEIPPHKRPINTVFQKYALFPHLNVYGNIAYGLKLQRVEEIDPKDPEGKKIKLRKYTKAEISEKVGRALHLVGLEGYEQRDVTSLSGGQQQRVAIARALVLRPKVLLLDEPLGALDLKMRKEMQLELMEMHKKLGITFVYVTHDQEEALTMSDIIVVMKDGVVQQIGSPKAIYDEPANAFVADFIGESNIISATMIEDYKVRFLDTDFKCLDKNFGKNEEVDVVIRPEDIKLTDVEKGMLTGKVTSQVFKGTFYEMNVLVDDYEFTVQSTESRDVGETVGISVKPNGLHIMKKMLVSNQFITEMDSDESIDINGVSFNVFNNGSFKQGDKVKASVSLDDIILTDYEEDGIVAGNIVQTVYKGSYFQVQVSADNNCDFWLDSDDEWDIGDRVGILIKPESFVLEKVTEDSDEQC